MEQPKIVFHDQLNPLIWDDTVMKPQVRLTLLRNALAFFKFLDVKFKVIDIVLTGSNAAYNYTSASDCDVHIVSDYDKLGDVASKYFSAQKQLWSLTHDCEIFGMPIELYIEDCREEPHAQGQYSLLKKTWISKPKKTKPDWNDALVRSKTKKFAHTIDEILSRRDEKEIALLIKRLHRYRQLGLEDGGEFSTENLVYKTLRNMGYIQTLYDLEDSLETAALSLDRKD